MAKTAQEVMQLIHEQGIKMVDFKMVDINGQYRHVTIPAQNFTETTMTDGIGFDASNYGYAVVEKSDMVFIPDPDTAQIDPDALDDRQCHDHRLSHQPSAQSVSAQHRARGGAVYA